jgi:hypothetical protein
MQLQVGGAALVGTLVLFAVLGLGSWITVNGVFQELPLLAHTAPEGVGIFAYAAVAVALANMFPLAYVALVAQFTAGTRRWVDALASVLLIGVVGVGACVALATSWGAVHNGVSWALILLTFLSGGVDCTTSVLFFPIAARFPSSCTSALFVGESLTGLLAALLAFAQQPDGGGDSAAQSLRFSVSAYFAILALVMLCSAVAAAAIFAVERCALQRDPRRGESVRLADAPSEQRAFVPPPELAPAPAELQLQLAREGGVRARRAPDPSGARAARSLLAAQFALAFVENGLLVTLIPRSLALYPSSAVLVSVALKVGFGGAGAAAVLALLATRSAKVSAALERRAPRLGAAAFIVGSAAWLFVTAALPVAPGSPLCGALTAVVAVLVKWMISFVKTLLFLRVHPAAAAADAALRGLAPPPPQAADTTPSVCDARNAGGDDAVRAEGEGVRVTRREEKEERGLYDVFRWGGAGIQLGSASSALLFFLLAEVLHIFH